MKKLILILLTFSLSTLATDQTIELEPNWKQETVVTITPDSPDEIKIKYDLVYSRRAGCYDSAQARIHNRGGCILKKYEKANEKESIILNIENASGKLGKGNQKVSFKVVETKRYSSKFKVIVEVIEGPEDSIEYSSSWWSDEYKFNSNSDVINQDMQKNDNSKLKKKTKQSKSTSK